MTRLLFSLVVLAGILRAQNTPSSHTCQACHPAIYREYSRSMHARASIYGDPVHRAIWNLHPDRKAGRYSCGHCHTPSDPSLTRGEALPRENTIQREEPIPCQSCHRISRIEHHARADRNIYRPEARTFYAADPRRKGSVLRYHETTFLGGLFGGISGSPFHTVDYGNELYYNGEVCLGCHSHKQNAKGFAICDLGVERRPGDKSCIQCHMPKTDGPLANQKPGTRHAFHGSNLHDPEGTKRMGRYIKLSYRPVENGFNVVLKNTAPHTLFAQPLRLGELRGSLYRNGEVIPLPSRKFFRRIGHDGHPTPPWLADSVLKDSTIRAHESRTFHYSSPLEPGDLLTLTLGYHPVDPAMAKKIPGIPKEATRFLPIKQRSWSIAP